MDPSDTQPPAALPAADLAPAAAPAPAETPAVSADPAVPLEASDLEEGIVEALKTVFDPEIPVNIYELGLIYDIDVQGSDVKLKMTLTSPGCPVAGSLPGEVKAKVEGVPGVASADVELVWEPTWNPSLMSEAARLQLGMF
jgi:FeS assembly SUF system protein